MTEINRADELRAELESAKARLCSHGVLPLNCNEPHDEEASHDE